MTARPERGAPPARARWIAALRPPPARGGWIAALRPPPARAEWIAALGALALGACFWLWRLGVLDYDDGVSNELRVARGPLASILLDLPWADQSPLYFVLLWIWRVFGESPLAVKSLNLLLVGLTVLAVTAAARAAHGRARVAGAAALIAALSPMSFWMVRNGRMYAPQLLLSALTLLLVLRALERRSPRALALLVLVSALNVYNHFFAFLITAVAWSALAIDWTLDPRGRSERVRGLAAPAAAAAALALLVGPQLLRLAALADAPPSPRGWSLPPLSVRTMETIQHFWFQSAAWGSLRRTFPPVDELFYTCTYTLAVLGTLLSSRRVARLTVLWFAVPTLGLGLAAAHLDLRPRYFGFVAPVLWIAIAQGALGAFPDTVPWRTARRVLSPLRVACLAVFLGCTAWLLVQKLPQRYAEWTKVMTGLDRLYRPDMVLYMPPGPQRGVPRAVARHSALHPDLRRNERLDATTRARFLAELAAHRPFVFLLHHRLDNEEVHWRRLLLADSGYERAVVPGYAARAEIYTREPLTGFTLSYALPEDASEARLLAWARRRLADPRRAPAPASRLAAALVARVHDDGRVAESVLYLSQRGEAGSWRLSGRPDDGVSAVRAWAGGRPRPAYEAPLAPDSALLVAFPDLPACGTLRLLSGRPDDGSGSTAAPVEVAVLAAGARAALTVPPEEGWHEQRVQLACSDDETGPILLLRERADDPRPFFFDLR